MNFRRISTGFDKFRGNNFFVVTKAFANTEGWRFQGENLLSQKVGYKLLFYFEIHF